MSGTSIKKKKPGRKQHDLSRETVIDRTNDNIASTPAWQETIDHVSRETVIEQTHDNISSTATWQEAIDEVLNCSQLLFNYKGKIFQSNNPTQNHYKVYLQRFGKNQIEMIDIGLPLFKNQGYVTQKRNIRLRNSGNVVLKFSPLHAIHCPDIPYIQSHHHLNAIDLLDNFLTSNEFPDNIAEYILRQCYIILRNNGMSLYSENVKLEECFYLLIKLIGTKLMDHDYIQRNCNTYLSMILKDLLIIPDNRVLLDKLNHLMNIINVNVPIYERCDEHLLYNHIEKITGEKMELCDMEYNLGIVHTEQVVNAIKTLYKLHLNVVTVESDKDPFVHAIFEYAVRMCALHYSNSFNVKKLIHTYIALCMCTSILLHPRDIVAFDDNIQLSDDDMSEIEQIVINKHPKKCKSFNNFCHFIEDDVLKAYGSMLVRQGPLDKYISRTWKHT